MGALVPVGTAALTQALTNVANTAFQKLAMLGKSPEQKQAEYTIAEITNDIERAMDINRWAFWSGLISQDAALENYAYLWYTLENTAAAYAEITAAQASRLLSDRDYGGKYGELWRGVFRDQIVNVPMDHLQNGYVVPEWQWDWGIDKLKYGDAPADIRTPYPLPTPEQFATFEGTAPGQGIGSAGAFSLIKWAGLGLLAWKAVRFIG